VLQYQAHRHLFELKLKTRSLPPAQKYSLPTEGMFRWLACPHYCAEILIYASLCIASSQPNWAAVGLVVWVASNLAVVAKQQLKWYKATFPNTPKHWKALVPFVH
jgi:3-oxo-5-alpha-steroid 4-dehydrogenase 3